MIVDTSALLAVLLGEPERHALLAAMARTNSRRIAAPNWLEACMVLEGRTALPPGHTTLEHLLRDMRIDVAPFDFHLAEVALTAFRRFGRGNHPAKLNFGDCMAYALARSTGEPLLFKGDDFAKTDITPARH